MRSARPREPRGLTLAAASPDPLQAALDGALDARLDPASAAPLALGLSGGSDSLALLHLAAAWCARVGRPLLALTVDHGLAAESAGWTARAGRMAARAGVTWRALAWHGDKPATGLPAAARAARHALLADAARAGARVLLLAHTADDLAETEALRAGPAPGIGRLREWSPSPAWPQGRGVFLVRPLLAVRRDALRAWLTAQSLVWIEDPANADVRFARARLRAAGVPPPLRPRTRRPASARRWPTGASCSPARGWPRRTRRRAARSPPPSRARRGGAVLPGALRSTAGSTAAPARSPGPRHSAARARSPTRTR